MDAEFIDLTPENIEDEHLCCIIRTKKGHPGIEAKRAWLKERLSEGHVFRKLNVKGCAFIEYSPLEAAWVPVVGDNFYGRTLMESCIEDARAHGRSGVCMLGAEKQKAWLSDQSFAKKFGFTAVDRTDNGYELLELSFDGSIPRFAAGAKQMTVDAKGLTVYYELQCPYIPQRVEKLREHCNSNGIPAEFILVDSLEKAKALPCVFNNWAVFYDGKFVTVNQIDAAMLEKLIKR